MFVAKNKFVTKTKDNAEYFDIFFSNMFAMMPSNETWKLHRKTCSPMFYKNKLTMMGKVFKEHLTIATSKWRKEVEANGETRILLSEEFERIYAHTINHICFGQDLNDDKFDWLWFDIEKDTFVEKKVSLRLAMQNMAKITDTFYWKKLTNPVSAIAKVLFKMDLEIGPFFKSAHENSRRLQAHLKKYVTDRKSGVTKSQMEGMDLLSAFLENQDVFSDDAIVNGIKGIIFAAIETTNFSSQTLHSTFAQRDDIVQKVRKEFDDNVRKPVL